MQFAKPLREGIQRGRIRCTIRVWQRLHVKVGGRYPMEGGHVVVDEIVPLDATDVTEELARESGFGSVEALMDVARHGPGDRVFLIRAAGRTGPQILAELERRLDNDDEAERAETVRQLREIALLRLDRLVGE